MKSKSMNEVHTAISKKLHEIENLLPGDGWDVHFFAQHKRDPKAHVLFTRGGIVPIINGLRELQDDHVAHEL